MASDGQRDTFSRAPLSSSSSSSSSSSFELIGGSLYRKKLEKGFVQYREVLSEDKRLQSISTFHQKKPDTSHLSLDDTYRLVAQHYWWEGMFFQVRDFVFNCEECQQIQHERSTFPDVGPISRMLESHSGQVLRRLNVQREAGLFCDITLMTAGGQSFLAHKAVLAAVSEYFQELFTEMDANTNPQAHVDLTAFSAQSLLALLEFSYTSTLTINLDNLTEVCAMARHLRMWPALEVCTALKREQETRAGEPRLRKHSTAEEANKPMPGSFRRNLFTESGRDCGLTRRREDEEGEGSGPSSKYCEHISDEDDLETSGFQFQSQFPPENGFSPCSPNRRMKLMDFKSPSCKKKLSCHSTTIPSSSCTSTRSSSPSRRVLRSSPGAALALRRLLPKIDLSSKRKRKSSSYRPYRSQRDFPVPSSQSQAASLTHTPPVQVKEEEVEEEVCSMVPQDEVHSPRAQEKYRLLSFLGLQRKSLLPGPEELSGWGQKKRLRKLKVSNYSLTVRRKPRAQGVPVGFGTQFGVLAAVSPSLSLCDMSRMDLLNRPVNVEALEAWNRERSKRKKKVPEVSQSMEPVARSTRSRALLQRSSGLGDRPLGRHHKSQDDLLFKPAARGRAPTQNAYSTKSTVFRIKRESSDVAILQPIHRRNTVNRPQEAPTAPRAASSARRGRPADRTVRLAPSKSQQKHGLSSRGKPAAPKVSDSKAKCKYPNAIPQSAHSRTERRTQVKENKKVKESSHQSEGPDVQYGVMNWSTNPDHLGSHSHPLYKTIKEEPADPLPLSPSYPTCEHLDLGKRLSKPPVKLLDQGFLFEFCRPPGGIKREEESVEIFSPHEEPTPKKVKRDRLTARLLPDRTGLNGPHWAGLGNRHRPFSERNAAQVKTEVEEASVSRGPRCSTRVEVSKKRCKIKKEPTEKNVNKMLPASSRHSVLVESIQRAGLKRKSKAHTCLQCQASYRDCDALIMHRIRHIEGKHWPCPLCSKTFFRQRNVRNHIRTHDPKLYKCRQCVSTR